MSNVFKQIEKDEKLPRGYLTYNLERALEEMLYAVHKKWMERQ